MFRICLALLLAATAAPLAAFFAQPAGYNLNEYIQTSGAGSISWDPAGADFYANHNGGIRRFDTVTNTFSSTAFFAAPASIPPASYAFFDAMAIDPANPNDFFVSYSGFYSRLHKLTRTGPDSCTITTTFDFSANGDFVYDLAFIPDVTSVPANLRGQLICAASQGFGGPAKLYLVNRTTLAITELADVGTTNGSGPITADEDGNVYTTVPPTFGSFTGISLLRFPASDLSAAIGGTPVQASDADVVIAAADAEWNINAISARTEGGGAFLYYTTIEHSSVFRMCLATGESREFIHGFGGVADGYLHYAQAGKIAFSSAADDFHPAGGGAVVMAVPFSVYTPGGGFSSVYNSVFLFDPEPVNVAVASLVVTQQPGAINSGVPFSITLNALNGSGGTILSNVGVVVTASGGQLDGFTITSQPGDSLLVDGLVYTTATLPGTVTLTATLAGGGVSVGTAAITVLAPASALAVTVQPSGVFVSEFFGATLELRDAGGAVVVNGPDATRPVTVTVQSGPGNLWGQTTEAASAGVAVFDTLIFDAPGMYVLEFESAGLAPQTVNVTVASAPSGDGGGSEDENTGCSTGGRGSGWPLPVACLVALFVAFRLRRAARA